jgi:hypothetical protein
MDARMDNAQVLVYDNVLGHQGAVHLAKVWKLGALGLFISALLLDARTDRFIKTWWSAKEAQRVKIKAIAALLDSSELAVEV